MIKRKEYELTDDDIKYLITKEKIISIVFYDKLEEITHIKQALSVAKDKDLINTLKFNFNELINNPKCKIVIMDSKLIGKLKGHCTTSIKVSQLDGYDISKIRQHTIKEELLYNLFDLPEMKPF